MATAIAIIIAIFCAYKGLIWRVCFEAALLWIKKKEYTPPSEEEMSACIKAVCKQTFRIK